MRFDINTDLTVQAWEEMAAVSTASWISSSVSSASSATETPPPAPTKKLPRRRIRIQNTTVYQTLTPEEAEEGNEGFTKFLPPVATGRPARTKPRFSFLFGSMTATTAVYS